MSNLKKSNQVYFINVPKPFDDDTFFNSKFVYNFYTTDEKVQENPIIPDVYKKSTISKNDINLSTFSLRVPRYVELNWKLNNSFEKASNKEQVNLEKNYSKIITQENLSNSNFLPRSFDSNNVIYNAIEDINKNYKGETLTSLGISQATITENFIADLMTGYEETAEQPSMLTSRETIKEAINSIESFSNNPELLSGYSFFNEYDEKIKTGINALANVTLQCQLNRALIQDFFNFSTTSNDVLSNVNKFIKYNNLDDDENLAVKPISVGEEVNVDDVFDATKTVKLSGYIIDRYKVENDLYVKDKTFFINNINTTSLIDVNVKYGATYYYFIRTVAQFEIPSILENSQTINSCKYYCAGESISSSITCEETVPPPPPTELKFVWDYRNNSFHITWEMPFNSQRDIKQFQIFRRKSIYEPFELLEQQCFDFSEIKQTTGEIVDGNLKNITKENASFIKYLKYPGLNYFDTGFKVDFENLQSSKYIYALASIDAHGLISNYSAQFEVYFDFFKNQLIKKNISFSGAPRPYPNLLLNQDLFKDIIQVSGLSSQKLKIYFMPEYFKLKYDSGKVEKMITTVQDGSQGGYYTIQFINVQNQKMDKLKINVDDPNLLSHVP